MPQLGDETQFTLLTDSLTATEVPVLLSPMLLPDQELENAGESNHPTVQPTLSIPDSPLLTMTVLNNCA